MSNKDVYEMLSIDKSQLADGSASKSFKAPKAPKKIPKGMSRELYNIVAKDGDLPQMFVVTPTSVNVEGWRKTIERDKKRKAQRWQQSPFSAKPEPSAEKFLKHWTKVEDANNPYPFLKLDPHTFNNPIKLPTFTSEEYAATNTSFHYDQNNPWTEASTRHLFGLVSRFDMRFEVMQYYWDGDTYGKKDSIDLRQRFTEMYNMLLKIRGDKSQPLPPYDAVSDRKRKKQLDILQMRTQEEIDEASSLKEMEKKISASREDRERRQGAMQVRLSDIGRNLSETRAPSRSISQAGEKPPAPKKTKKTAGAPKKSEKKKLETSIPQLASITEPNLKFPEIKAVGAHSRSVKLKLPNSVTTKKLQALKAMLTELKLDDHPMADEEVIEEFNKLRNDLLLLYELKLATTTAVTDLQHLKAELGDDANDPQIAELLQRAEAVLASSTPNEKLISDRIEVQQNTSSRFRRKTTAEQLRSQKASTSQAE